MNLFVNREMVNLVIFLRVKRACHPSLEKTDVAADPDSQIINVFDGMIGETKVIDKVDDYELFEEENDLIGVAIIKAHEKFN